VAADDHQISLLPPAAKVNEAKPKLAGLLGFPEEFWTRNSQQVAAWAAWKSGERIGVNETSGECHYYGVWDDDGSRWLRSCDNVTPKPDDRVAHPDLESIRCADCLRALITRCVSRITDLEGR